MGKGTHPIHRKLLDHWLWKDKPFARGQAWIDLILMANHAPSKFMYNNVVIEVKEGQLFRAKLQLAKRWGWSRGKLNRYLARLETEHMMIQQTVQQGTLITLLNYNHLRRTAFGSDTIGDTTDGTTIEQQAVQRQDTYNKIKNVKNEKKEEYTHERQQIISYLNQKTGKEFTLNSAIAKKYINARLKEGRTVDDFIKVIDIKATQWLKDKEMNKYLRPETLFKPSKFESYLNEKPSKWVNHKELQEEDLDEER